MERREALRTTRAIEPEASPARTAGSDEPPAENNGRLPAREAREADPQLQECWGQIQEALRELVQPEQFETWFRRAEVRSVADGKVCICVQNDFTRDWLTRSYITQLERAVRKVLGPNHRLEFAVDPELTVADRPAESQAVETGSRA